MAQTSQSTIKKQSAFYLADWLVDGNADEIQLGDKKIKLESKVMAVLLYLARHPNTIVTREELEEEIWSNTIVGYDALTGSITKLRKALGDNARNPKFIETVSKKGYRLIAPVVAQTVPTSTETKKNQIRNPLSDNKRYWIAGIFIILLSIGGFFVIQNQPEDTTTHVRTTEESIPSIVVLPFVDLNKNPKQSYFSDGVTADITTALSKLSGLFVIAWSSAVSYKDQIITIKEVSKSLGVRYVLEGKVRREKDNLRVNVQLIDAETGRHLWAERYDRTANDILTVQDDITNKVLSALSVTLTQEEKRRVAERYTNSVTAYEDYLKGRSFQRSSQEEVISAREHYQLAIDRDPDFARAYGAIAISYVDEYRFRWGEHPSEALSKALGYALKAVEIDNNLPQAYWVLSYVHLHRHEFKKSLSAIKKARDLAPNGADNYGLLALNAIYTGKPEKAVSYIQRATLLNPYHSAHYPSLLGQAYFAQGNFNKALPKLREAIERNSNLLTPHIYLVVCLVKLDKIEEAKWEAEQIRLIAPKFSINDMSGMYPFIDKENLKPLINSFNKLGF